ncbi:MAG: hypothetical protein IIB28_07110 [Chloroflexi bacterium]|nr:hypothetical protein [Chloroflexota bacterium]
MSPPVWALLERELLRAQSLACQKFYERYFDERGYLRCVPRWGGDDGADDAAENLTGWTILHALGAPDIVLEMYKQGWDGHVQQYTEAKTVEVPFARDGMYYKEFPVMFDWFHNGEGLSPFVYHGLSEPQDPSLRRRMTRYAGFYMNEDPLAQNYDPEHKVIRSMFNGSRGPLLRKATGLDWAGDPIEVEGRFNPHHGERDFEQMLAHFKDYNDVEGDHPLNLGTTTLALNAYMLTGDEKYRAWMLEYTDAWCERAAQNGGIVPTNIGLDGTIGGACDGKWYGGVYGWGFTVVVPQTGALAHRPFFSRRCYWAFANALLLTGDQRYVDVWRNTLDAVNSNRREIDGTTMYPHMYGDDGWYDFTPDPLSVGALEVYYWSMDEADRGRVPPNDWLAFLEGEDPGYPEKLLREELANIRQRVERIDADDSSADTTMSDDMNRFNPGEAGTLERLMLGGLPTAHAGFPLHCRFRYFDPVRRRAGIPEDVAALVDGMSSDESTLTLVNVNPVESRSLVVQGGAYGEHQILSVARDGEAKPIGSRSFAVNLAPGAGAQLTIKLRRFANEPTLDFPPL